MRGRAVRLLLCIGTVHLEGHLGFRFEGGRVNGRLRSSLSFGLGLRVSGRVSWRHKAQESPSGGRLAPGNHDTMFVTCCKPYKTSKSFGIGMLGSTSFFTKMSWGL